jgi:hypothetical protein
MSICSDPHLLIKFDDDRETIINICGCYTNKQKAIEAMNIVAQLDSNTYLKPISENQNFEYVDLIVCNQTIDYKYIYGYFNIKDETDDDSDSNNESDNEDQDKPTLYSNYSAIYCNYFAIIPMSILNK